MDNDLKKRLDGCLNRIDEIDRQLADLAEERKARIREYVEAMPVQVDDCITVLPMRSAMDNMWSSYPEGIEKCWLAKVNVRSAKDISIEVNFPKKDGTRSMRTAHVYRRGNVMDYVQSRKEE